MSGPPPRDDREILRRQQIRLVRCERLAARVRALMDDLAAAGPIGLPGWLFERLAAVEAALREADRTD
jgi:hypothetical protein